VAHSSRLFGMSGAVPGRRWGSESAWTREIASVPGAQASLRMKTSPLKPKDGLSGAPALASVLWMLTCRIIQLKKVAGVA
jgi:hypothetical protein